MIESPSRATGKLPMSIADEIDKLQRLYQSGAIDGEEFAQAKSRILNGPPPIPADLRQSNPAEQEEQTKLWGMFLHLSIFAGYLVPIAGWVAPIVIWQLKKNELPGIDIHGKNAVNWIISHAIYLCVSVMLVFFVVGIPCLLALGVVAVVFPVVAAIKANNGEVWEYPLSIKFLQ
jgi:uncharacterized Tic20 family protein